MKDFSNDYYIFIETYYLLIELNKKLGKSNTVPVSS